MSNDGIPIKPGTPFESLGSPVSVMEDGVKVNVIDPFYAMIDGARSRVYPGTGAQVELGQLDEDIRYVGGNVGLGDNEKVDLVDAVGNWTSASLGDLFISSVWMRLSDAARSQILGALPWSAFAKTVGSETLKTLPADVATACQVAQEGGSHA